MKRRWLVASSCLSLLLMRGMSCTERAAALSEPLHVRLEDSSSASVQAAQFPAILQYHVTPQRVLKGDYETPENLLLVYDQLWEESVAAIIEAAEHQAQVGLIVNPGDMAALAASGLASFEHVDILRTPTNSPWVRDYGPLELYDAAASRLWLDFDYAWYRPADDRLPRWLSLLFQTDVLSEPAVLDGGAILSNGAGLCAISGKNLLDMGFDAGKPEQLAGFFPPLGCTTVAILPELVGEPTGHADMMAQFLSTDQAMVASADASRHPQLAQQLDQAAQRLTLAADLHGIALDLARVPLAFQDGRFYTYVNSTRLSQRLLVPHFEVVEPLLQAAAYQALQRALPDVELARVPADKLINHGGAVHCATLGLGSTQRQLAARRSRATLPPAPRSQASPNPSRG